MRALLFISKLLLKILVAPVVHSMPRIPLKSISQAKITTNVLFARS